MKNRFLVCIITSILLVGCGAKDNTPKPAPLVNFTPTATVTQLWSTSTGNGNNGKFLRLDASYDNGVIYTADNKGHITATNAQNGDQLWQINTKQPISAGPTASNGIVVVGTSDAHVITVSEKNANILWDQTISSIILAAPTLYKDNVLVKSVDGKIVNLDANSGKQRWSFSQDVPSLILRGSSSATVDNNQVYIGFANGTLASLALDTGSPTWTQAIATTQGYNDIENMIDIDTKPIVKEGIIYVATYQGNIAALNAITGTVLWQHPLSSYSGIAIDSQAVYSSDASSHIWAYDQNTGGILWHQDALSWRNTTGPAVMNNTVVVGDMQGYVHWLSIKDGQFVARTHVGNAIMAAPIVVNNTLYVFTANGTLAAYQLIS